MENAAKLGLKQFEIENDIITEDRIFEFDEEKYQEVLQARPWNKSPDYFKRVKISAIALIKMVTHTKSGGNIEVMGLMQGKVFGDTIIIMDAYPLPVEATETRVNAQAEAYEFIGKYNDLAEEAGRLENISGWYHSHPSYGCWLSGIDVGTQQLYQRTGPMVAIVIDPIRTMSTGKVEIGAFRTYPDGYKLPGEGESDQDLIPLNKIEDWGLHANKYYPLQVSYYKSSLDAKVIDILWNKYWINTLSNNNLVVNQEYGCDKICDLSQKVAKTLAKGSKYDKVLTLDHLIGKGKSEFRDFIKFSMEKSQNLVQESLKGYLFSSNQS